MRVIPHPHLQIPLAEEPISIGNYGGFPTRPKILCGRTGLAVHAGAIAAVCGILLHSFVDFNLHIPSNALLFLLQAYLATLAPFLSEETIPRPLNRRRANASSPVGVGAG